MSVQIIVSQQGDGNFKTIGEAIAALPQSGGEILIKAGIYEEKIDLRKPNVTLIGEDAEKTVITYGDGALKLDEDGKPYETFRTATFYVGADHLTAKNLTFENHAGKGNLVGQAVAVYVNGDQNYFEQVRFVGHQDTLFIAPRPETKIDGTAFEDPLFIEEKPKGENRSHFKDCYIAGDVDFIFGGGVGLFEDCEIFSRANHEPSYITAPCTPADQLYGFVFYQCRLTSDGEDGQVYLGRPWRDHGKAVFIDCAMGSHIHPDGWHDWEKPHARATARFKEYGSYGKGAQGARVSWCETYLAL